MLRLKSQQRPRTLNAEQGLFTFLQRVRDCVITLLLVYKSFNGFGPKYTSDCLLNPLCLWGHQVEGGYLFPECNGSQHFCAVLPLTESKKNPHEPSCSSILFLGWCSLLCNFKMFPFICILMFLCDFSLS